MFQKALAWIKTVLSGAGSLTPLLALFGVAIPPVAVAAIPVAIAMMTAAEDAYGDGTGPIKHEAVATGLNALAGYMQKNSTGGQAETWKQVTPEVVGTMIDTIATVANNVAAQAGTRPIFDEQTNPTFA